MSRAYYASDIEQFIKDSPSYILGELSTFHSFSLDELQRNAWLKQIEICKTIGSALASSYIAFEFSIPRMGKRVDVILLHKGIIFVLEFKVGDKQYTNSALTQALDYALDLKNFHEQSHSRYIVPIFKRHLHAMKWQTEKELKVKYPKRKHNLKLRHLYRIFIILEMMPFSISFLLLSELLYLMRLNGPGP